MAFTIYSSKDNQWREYLNPLRGLTLERIVQYIEQGERGAFADLQWFYQAMEKSDALKELEYLAIAQSLVKDGRGYLPNGTDVKYVNGGGSGRPPFRDHLDYLDKQITLLGTGGLLTMLTESGSGTLAGSAHQEAFNQVAKADAVMVSEALQRDFDAPLLEAAFPGWPVEAGFELSMEAVGAPGYGPMPTGSLPPAADGGYASKIQVGTGP